jgi:sugar phosphate isomerase/epimerase
MLRIMLPCSPFDINELSARAKILEEYVGKKYPIGLELVGGWEDFFNEKAIKVAKNNLEKIDKSIYLSLHAPLNKKDLKRSFFNFGNKNSAKDFLYIVKLAEDLGVSLINFHAPAIFSYKQVFKKNIDLNFLAEKQIEKVAKDLDKINFKGILCAENVTDYYGAEDLEIKNLFDFKNINFSAGFVDLKDFLKLHEKQDKAFVTIDICHLSTICDSSEVIGKMREVAPLIRHIHFNDGLTVWRPLLSEFREGLVPGDGEIGKRVFKEDIVPFLVGLSKEQDINIMIEVLREDYITSENSKESLKRLLDWLG